METEILKSILNLGVFPAVTIYLMFIIIKDFKGQLKDMEKTQNSNYKIITEQYMHVQKTNEEILTTVSQTHNYLMTYLNNLLIKLLDVLDDYDKN